MLGSAERRDRVCLVREAIKMNKKKQNKGGQIERIEKELQKLKEERRKMMDIIKEGDRREERIRQLKTVKNRIEKKRRTRREVILREKIDELEICYQARDTRRYWNKLKEVGGWKRKGGGRIPETVVDEKGKEHSGQDVLKVGEILSSSWE